MMDTSVSPSETSTTSSGSTVKSSSSGAQKTPPNEAATVFPLTRIKTIMRSSPDVSNIGQDGLFLMTKAVEFFVENLVMNAYDGRSSEKRILEYKDLANYVQDCDELEFLHEIIPRKVRVEDILQELKEDSPKVKKPDHAYS